MTRRQLLVAMAAQAQDPVIRITVRLVQVDAVVTDRKGRIVTDLEPADFEILQDGKPRPISKFSFISTDEPLERQPSRARQGLKPEDVRRTMVLFVDDLSLRFDSIAQVRDGLVRFIEEQVQPNDMVAIMRSGGDRSVSRGFTSDRRQLLAQARDVAFSHSSRQAQRPSRAQNDFISMSALTSLLWCVRGLRDMPGRKSIVMLSDGFRMHDFSGRPLPAYHYAQQAIEEAARSGVVMYEIGARGLVNPTIRADVSGGGGSGRALARRASAQMQNYQSEQNTLHFLAESTGGLYFGDMNDIAGMLAKVSRDQSGYYLLGFDPGFDTFDRKFHKVQIKVKRPGLKVRSREGYVAVEEPPQGQLTRQQALVKAVDSPFHSHQIPLKLTALFTTDDGGRSYANCLIHVDAKTVPIADDLDVLVVGFGPDGAPAGQVMRTVRIDTPADKRESLLKDGILVSVQFPLGTPGPHQVRVAVRHPNTGKSGSAAEFLDAPNLKDGKLALANLVMSDPGRRMYRPGERIEYGALIYNAHLDRATRAPKVDVSYRVLEGDRVLFESSPNPLDVGTGVDTVRLAAHGAFQMTGSTTSGNYTLEMTVTDRGGKKPVSATQWIDFSVSNVVRQ